MSTVNNMALTGFVATYIAITVFAFVPQPETEDSVSSPILDTVAVESIEIADPAEAVRLELGDPELKTWVVN